MTVAAAATAVPEGDAGTPAVELSGVSYRYPGRDRSALAGFDLAVAAGERLLVAGASGSGKSTLLRCLNGLVPHFYGGVLAGRVRVAGRDPVAAGPRGMSDAVGLVFQDPERQFVAQRVDDELAFAMENHDLPRAVMAERIAEALDRLGISHLRRRRVDTLSGGERQRVAIASVLTLRPAILVLDEPTSQLDPAAAGEVLAVLDDLSRRLGLTVIVSEHRLERIAGWARRVCYLPPPGRPAVVGAPHQVLAGGEPGDPGAPPAPPVARLARALGVRPAPLTVHDAGTLAVEVQRRLSLHAAPSEAAGDRERPDEGAIPPGRAATPGRAAVSAPPTVWRTTSGPAVEAREVHFRYGDRDALRGVSLAVAPGERVALVGANGAGKSTLFKVLVGLLRPAAGSVRILGRDAAGLDLVAITREVGLVPQNPARLLFADTVADEVHFTRRAHGEDPGDPAPLLERLGIGHLAAAYPHDLSGGERQRAAIAAILAAGPRVLLLDEPTRGLDYGAKETLARQLDELAAGGVAVVLATHDVELVARVAERMVVLVDGRVAADGPVGEVGARFPAYASEVARLLGDPLLLTVEDVLERLDAAV